MQKENRENQKGRKRERKEETWVPERADTQGLKESCKVPPHKSASRLKGCRSAATSLRSCWSGGQQPWDSRYRGTFMLVGLRNYR